MRLVNVLVVEDEQDKRDEICATISSFFGAEVSFDYGETFAEATRKILNKQYDLIIMDLLLPRRKEENVTDVSEEVVEHIANSELNRLTTVVAISRFEDVVSKRQEMFARAGIFLIRYSDTDTWKACLNLCMQKVAFKTAYDFVIICALDIERSAFEAVSFPNFEFGDLVHTHGLDGRELRIGDLGGVCVLQPRMGLVDAGIIAAQALSAFSPKLICMSGICGGFEKESPLGTLLVSDMTFEHQAGKWKGDMFELHTYQERLDNDVRTVLRQMIERDPALETLKSKAHEIAVPSMGAKISPTTSGSSVIASTPYSEIIRKHHGKVAGVDMEVYAVHRAAALNGRPVLCFAAKTVVDHADEAKDSKLQQAGAILSARFTVKAIEEILFSCRRE